MLEIALSASKSAKYGSVKNGPLVPAVYLGLQPPDFLGESSMISLTFCSKALAG